MKKIYIILMHTNTLPSKFVKAFTQYAYSHVAISLTKDCYTTYSFGRRGVYNLLNGGFAVQNKDGKFFKRFNKTICKIYELEITDEQYEAIKREIKRIEKNRNIYKYDFLGAFLRWLNKPVTFENKFVCSHFVAYILEKSQTCNFGKATCLVLPQDFTKIDGIKEIYNGVYLLYK